MSAPTEESVGISAFTTLGKGFRAATKQRFSDFIVREVDLTGKVVRLTSLPEIPDAGVNNANSTTDTAVEPKLVPLVGEEQTKAILALNATATGGGEGQHGAQSLVLDRDDDKDHRRDVHRLVKELLPHLQTDTVDSADGQGKSVRLMTPLFLKQARQDAQQANEQQRAGGGRNRGGGGKRKRGYDDRVEWPKEAGDNPYLGFTLYKENKDSTEAISRLARLVGMGPNSFQVAGTKDKRGVTTQRVNVYRLHPSRLAKAMAQNPFGDSIHVGNLTYEDKPLRMGAHGGNRFTIVLRDVSCAEAELESACSALQAKGFINYFGLQRFGNNDTAATHKLGTALLRGDFAAVLDMILAPRPGERSDERHARDVWAQTQDASAALAVLPRQMTIERLALEGIAKHGRANGLHALSKLPRSLRSMYLHAFQSMVFNRVASVRVKAHGCDKAIAGDLVWSAGSAPPAFAPLDSAEVKGGGAVAGNDAGVGSSTDAAAEETAGADAIVGDLGEELAMVADSGGGAADWVPHVVTAEEEEAGTYGIEDVLLPLPGHKVIMPTNSLAAEYTKVLEECGLTMASLNARVADLAIPGSYRKLIQKPLNMAWKILRYDDPNLPLATTDLMTLRGEPEAEGVPDGKLTAARLEFTLPSSTYATMCLRELTKQSTERAHQMQLNSSSVDRPEGSWVCPSCDANCFPNRTECYRCKNPRPQDEVFQHITVPSKSCGGDAQT